MTQAQASILVDSQVFIELLRAGTDPARALAKRASGADLVTCGVVVAEVLRGVKSPRLRERMEAFFASMYCVETDALIWDAVWRLAWSLDREGKVLPLTDLVIASCAFHAGSRVLTDDRHFDLIPGLRLIRLSD